MYHHSLSQDINRDIQILINNSLINNNLNNNLLTLEKANSKIKALINE